ncbi:MAG: hypothetical protein UY70_C0014G0012 [Candidatus Kaiserbacteria bacterium GW2011_GWB1_52_6]|uniref:Uncharacterized protein n=2 Tax=Candidatus Kaiseribacteriota TaxID=1752734 RepID=A0A0G1ZHM0_9BACT|nr:MAG: hypothetical protein UY67_C0011G0033 [Candidatus Kaiserbacteria bacterium GW2011_GWA2_52_12]KKW27447.1 MAG: hypothetical protein UY70_C0014G0012 [Candidatus Kaiserbacteria bacterium GW2011_GWB1_52_6]
MTTTESEKKVETSDIEPHEIQTPPVRFIHRFEHAFEYAVDGRFRDAPKPTVRATTATVSTSGGSDTARAVFATLIVVAFAMIAGLVWVMANRHEVSSWLAKRPIVHVQQQTQQTAPPVPVAQALIQPPVAASVASNVPAPVVRECARINVQPLFVEGVWHCMKDPVVTHNRGPAIPALANAPNLIEFRKACAQAHLTLTRDPVTRLYTCE